MTHPMTTVARIHKLFPHPFALALLTSSLGFGASLTTREPTHFRTPAVNPEPHTHVEHEATALALPAPTLSLTDAQAKLAQRFTAALNSPEPKHAVTRSAPTAGSMKPGAMNSTNPTSTRDSTRVWACGEWEDLVQGRGRGRTCEWR